MKILRFIIPFLVLALIFGFTPSCTRTEPEVVEPVEEEPGIVEKSVEKEQAVVEEPIVEEKPVEKNLEEDVAEEPLEEESEEEITVEEPIKPTSRENPATLGETFLVSMDDWLVGKLTFEIEMREVISGDKAWEMVTNANQFNDEPKEGKEYILAKFRIKVIETEEDNPFEVNHAIFDVISGSGVEYTDFISVAGIDPDLDTDLYEGADYKGWTYFIVDKDDDNPLGVFDRGGEAEIWFKLRP